jgi:hypothetical protein
MVSMVPNDPVVHVLLHAIIAYEGDAGMPSKTSAFFS